MRYDDPVGKAAAGGRAERPRIVRLTAEQRRTQLLDIAAELIVAHGFDALTMEAVGDAAGASKTLGYAYFGNVDDLILALWERELGHLYDLVVAASEGASDLTEKYAASMHAYWDLVAARGQLLASLQSGINARRLDTSRSPRTEEFISWFADAICAEYDVTRRTAITLAIAATSVPNLFSNAMSRRGANRAELEALSIRFGVAGLRAALDETAKVQPEPPRNDRRRSVG